MIALGRDLDDALAVTVEVENLCEQYWRALQLGEPHILSEAEMRDVFQQFKGYGNGQFRYLEIIVELNFVLNLTIYYHVT